jgi:peptidoglycan/LPS O-acetylase OafA/YrhL
LGKISFSVYLVHLPVLYAVSFLVMRTSLSVTPVLVLYVVGTVLITIGVSSLTYKYIEEWGRITSKRWAASIGKSRSSVVV